MKAPEHAPDEWFPAVEGNGTCFHSALTRWAQHHEAGEVGWRIGLGVVEANRVSPRHVHAWLERGDHVMAARGGELCDRAMFYTYVGIERDTVRLVSPRRILRRLPVGRDAVGELLDLWGRPWKVHGGGVVPA